MQEGDNASQPQSLSRNLMKARLTSASQILKEMDMSSLMVVDLFIQILLKKFLMFLNRQMSVLSKSDLVGLKVFYL